jgi:hypothetical protein
MIGKEIIMPRKRMPILQDTCYFITEWDGSNWPVTVRSVGADVLRRRADGSPYICAGGDVFVQYQDGLCHRVTASHFQSLSPRLAWIVPLTD